MIEHAVRVGATMARERVAERIADALAADVAKTAAAATTPGKAPLGSSGATDTTEGTEAGS
jgi:hypothetical protein